MFVGECVVVWGGGEVIFEVFDGTRGDGVGGVWCYFWCGCWFWGWVYVRVVVGEGVLIWLWEWGDGKGNGDVVV